MDSVADRFQGITWHYAPRDSEAQGQLEARIAEVGRREDLITYSDLVRGVTFRLSNLKDSAYQIDPADWQDLDRTIVGDFLGYLSMKSYETAGFFSSALVVSKRDGVPGEGFYTLLRQLGLISKSKTDKAMFLWADHVKRAHAWYTQGSR